MNIDTRHLHYFLIVAEERNVGRAARRLHMSQPPLTRQIKTLEERLGAQLFDRHAKGLTLTAAGQELQTTARQVLAALDAATRRTREVAAGVRGTISIGFVSTALYSGLPDIVRRFRRSRPDVRVVLRELTADAQHDAFERGAIDIGITLDERDDPALDTVTLSEEPLVACLPSRHRLTGTRRPLPVEALAPEPFILFPRPVSPALYDCITGLVQAAGRSLRVGQEAVQMQTIIGLVSTGLGVALVPASMRALKRPGISYRELTGKTPLIRTVLRRPRTGTNAAAEAFVRFAADSVTGTR